MLFRPSSSIMIKVDSVDTQFRSPDPRIIFRPLSRPFEVPMKKKLCLACVFLLLFISWIILLKTVDTAPIAPEGNTVGFSTVNFAFHQKTGFNPSLYRLTEATGLLTILVCVLFVFLGAAQLFQRKSLKKVDPAILLLGGLYIVTILLYVLFNKVTVNVRPVILPDEEGPEASFPSSHTMLACVVLCTAIPMLGRYIRNPKFAAFLCALCVMILFVTVASRTLCGAHWLTDIIGAILLSLTMIFAFFGALEYLDKRYQTADQKAC